MGEKQTRICILLVGVLCSCLWAGGAFSAAPAAAHKDDPPPGLESINYEQHLNEQIPLDLVFTDSEGEQVQLSDYFQGKPVILVFAYYDCPMLCGLALEDLVSSLRELKETPGKDFQIVTVSIDPTNSVELAAGKKRLHLLEYGRQGAEQGWHWLTGEQEAIDRLTDAAGFRYFYDIETDEYAHPTGLVVLTPKGVISRYLLGIDYPPTDLRLALLEASEEKIGSPVDQFILFCYHYDPEVGRYSLAIMNILRLAGSFFAIGMGAVILSMVWRERHSRQRQTNEGSDDNG